MKMDELWSNREKTHVKDFMYSHPTITLALSSDESKGMEQDFLLLLYAM